MNPIINLNQNRYNFCKNTFNYSKNLNSILLHAYMMKSLFHLTYTFKLHDVISSCFVLNMMGYDGYHMKSNSLLMKSLLGYVEILLTLNILTAHDEQHVNVNALMNEDRTIPRRLQSTSKKIFKAICLLWSSSVSESVSHNSAYLAVF